MIKNVIIFTQILLAAGLVAVSLVTFSLYRQTQELSKKVGSPSVEQKETQEESVKQESSITTELAELKDYVDGAVATISANTTTTIVEKVTTVAAPSKSTNFIPLGSTASTTNTGWETVESSAVYIDIENDYGSDAYITWEASLKVAHGNGKAFARLWDDTNKIAVAGSEVTTTDNADFEQAQSGAIALWRGNNLYKVQIKSLNSFEVNYSSGRLKVSY